MTSEQRECVVRLRNQGMGYTAIAKAAKDIFPTLECCILMAEIVAAYGFFFVLAMQR